MSFSVIIIGIVATLAFIAAIIAIIIAIYFNQNKKLGSKGPTGDKGPAGDTGAIGPTGPRGDSTVKGFTFDNVLNFSTPDVPSTGININFIPGTLYNYNLNLIDNDNFVISFTNMSNQKLEVGQSVTVYFNVEGSNSTIMFNSNTIFRLTTNLTAVPATNLSVMFTITRIENNGGGSQIYHIVPLFYPN